MCRYQNLQIVLFSSSMPSTAANREQVVSLKLSCLLDNGVIGGEYTGRVSKLTLACLHTLVYEATLYFQRQSVYVVMYTNTRHLVAKQLCITAEIGCSALKLEKRL